MVRSHHNNAEIVPAPWFSAVQGCTCYSTGLAILTFVGDFCRVRRCLPGESAEKPLRPAARTLKAALQRTGIDIALTNSSAI